jgi:hypothetical protein
MTWSLDDLTPPEHVLLKESSAVSGCVCFANAGPGVAAGAYSREVWARTGVDGESPRDVSPASAKFGTWVNSLDRCTVCPVEITKVETKIVVGALRPYCHDDTPMGDPDAAPTTDQPAHLRNQTHGKWCHDLPQLVAYTISRRRREPIRHHHTFDHVGEHRLTRTTLHPDRHHRITNRRPTPNAPVNPNQPRRTPEARPNQPLRSGSPGEHPGRVGEFDGGRELHGHHLSEGVLQSSTDLVRVRANAGSRARHVRGIATECDRTVGMNQSGTRFVTDVHSAANARSRGNPRSGRRRS